MNIHHDLEKIKLVAFHYAEKHNCNYTIFIMNATSSGSFSLENGSTYEFVTDSYFEKERNNTTILTTTDEMKKEGFGKREDLIPMTLVGDPAINMWLQTQAMRGSTIRAEVFGEKRQTDLQVIDTKNLIKNIPAPILPIERITLPNRMNHLSRRERRSQERKNKKKR